MSVRPNNTDGYCDPDDVARYFRTLEANEGFTFETNPTERQVEDFILENSARIDRETGHAWREKQVVDEYHDMDGSYYYWAGTPLFLMKREIRTPLDPSKGDKIELYDGSRWEDWVADESYEEGRSDNGDYWVNSPDGTLYIYRRPIWFRKYRAIRLTYRYGQDEVPADIKQACAKLTAADLIRTDMFGDLLPSGTSGPSPEAAADSLEEQAMKTLERRSEVRTF